MVKLPHVPSGLLAWLVLLATALTESLLDLDLLVVEGDDLGGRVCRASVSILLLLVGESTDRNGFPPLITLRNPNPTLPSLTLSSISAIRDLTFVVLVIVFELKVPKLCCFS